MSTGDNSDFSTDDVNETVDEAIAITPAPALETEAQPMWARRTVLKAAALGAAAAVLVNKGPGGLQLGAPSALANDLSHLPCTANDVQIIGTGIVVNEPCDCTGTFTATVRFTVRNITSTGRYCVSVHLSDGR